jgi:hypothetical protein
MAQLKDTATVASRPARTFEASEAAQRRSPVAKETTKKPTLLRLADFGERSLN